MKICVITSSYPQFKYDYAGMFAYNLVLKNALKKDINQYVIAPHSKESKFFEDNKNHRVFRFPYFFPLSLQKLCYGSGIVENLKQNKILMFLIPFFFIAEFIFLIIISKRESFDLIHAHWLIPQGVIAYLCKKILKTPYIITIHGSDILTFKNSFFKKIYEIVLRNADYCTANSKKTAEIANSIKEINIEIIPMGVDLDRFYAEKIKEKQSDKKINPIVIFVGRLIDLKGVTFLLEAISKVKAKYPEIVLKIIGDGPEQSNLQRRVEELELQNNVTFFGTILNNKLPDIYRNSDVFVIPSIINESGETEGLGTVTLEAMACGIPVIGSNVGGIPDIIEDQVTGLLSVEKDSDSIAECIVRILEDDQLRQQMCIAALKIVEEEYSWDNISNEFIRIYNKILKL